jgi:hypothetical protein
MSKLFVFLLLMMGLNYCFRFIHFSAKTNLDYENIEKKTNVVEYFDIMSNPTNLITYKKMNLHNNNRLSCLHSALKILKTQSKFISFNNKNKPLIGIFACSTKKLSKILDFMQYTQQDFIDSFLPNGLFLFFLLIRNKKNPIGEKDFKLLFTNLISEIVEQCKSNIFDEYCYPQSKIQYILFPIDSYKLDDPIVQVLYETGFLKLNYRFDRIVFFKKYITFSTVPKCLLS